VENRWREAAKAAGQGADLDAMRAIDPDLVERESLLLGSAPRQVVDGVPEGGRRWWGHSPTTEAAVLGLTGRVVPPLGKGVVLVEDGGDYRGGAAGLTGGAISVRCATTRCCTGRCGTSHRPSPPASA
jgi:hypothetical protein